MTREIIGGLVSVLTVVAFVPYFRDVVRQRTHPHVFSWLPWATTMTIAAIAQIVDGAGPGAWPTIVNAVCDTSVLVLALRLGDYNVTRFDCVSLAGCVIAGLGWVITNTPLTAVVLITLVEVFAYMPTARKSWNRPYAETLSTYFINSVKCALAIIPIAHFSIVTVLYPAALVVRRRALGPSVAGPKIAAATNTKVPQG
jgi:hypothetical protein